MKREVKRLQTVEMTVQEASEYMHINHQALRERLKNNRYPEWGKAIKNARGTGYRYEIIRAKFYKYWGIEDQ